jgi:dTDP-4-dehydrorhamnose reductase
VRLVVTGREGQVVRALLEAGAGAGIEVVPLGRPEFDLLAGEEAIRDAIANSRPDVIVSAAAYTQVDKAEIEAELAFAVNEAGARDVAKAARLLGVPLIHLSTDYVFDGAKGEPYVEEDPTGPASVYGASKLAGERAVLAEHGDCAILRTAWVYSPFGSNFVKTMLRLAGEREEVSVVADQRGNPTSAADIATGVLDIAGNLVREDEPRHRGLFHMTGAGEASWAGFAEAIFEASFECGGPTARVRLIGTADYPTAARRPPNSSLDSSKLASAHGVRLPPWQSSTRKVIARLLQESA